MAGWARVAGLRGFARLWRRVPLRASPLIRRFWRGVAVALIAGALAVALFWVLVDMPNRMAPALDESVRFTQVNEARKTVAQIVGGVVVLVAGASTAWLTLRRVNALERQVALAAEGQVTERLSRAIEQLGATSDAGPIPEIRAGGVFSLERVAKESEASFEPVFQIVMGYLRTHSPRLADTDQQERDSLRVDIDAALSALERLVPLRPRSTSLVLPRVHMPGANLRGANLLRANLGGADLSMADLLGADLRVVNLVGANLSSAELTGADLRVANLSRASLRGAHLRWARIGTNLTGADLSHADLCEADLSWADLTGANLTGADLSSADPPGPVLRAPAQPRDPVPASQPEFSVGDRVRARIVEGERNLSGANLSRANVSGANLSGANLSGANLTDVEWDSETVWPIGFDAPPSAH